MAKADLHCHSVYSEHPSEWFLQRLGAKESYTDPISIYKKATAAGMDFVTITDHNKIDGVMLLREKYPLKVITGVETTTYFPEDGCKIHVLIYGLDSKQYDEINLIRKDIYHLRDYLKQEKLTHSVAHASYDVNGKLTMAHLEKLILLFDYFEAVNGGRNRHNNLHWQQICSQLTPDMIDDIFNHHRIDPFSSEPWIKGFTGGSDDHGDLFIGSTYTSTQADTALDFLQQINLKKSAAKGRHNSYHAFAFSVFKIAWDFSRQNEKSRKNKLLSKFTEQIFIQPNLELKDRIRLRTMKNMAELRGDQLKRRLIDLIEALQNMHQTTVDEKLDIVYDKISLMADAFLMIFLDSLESDLKEMNLIKLIRNISSSLPGIFMLLPFFSSMKHINQNREVLPNLKQKLGIVNKPRKRRILWFTDTLSDLNGVSITLKRMSKIAHSEGRELLVVGCLEDDQITTDTPPNFMNLNQIYRFPLPFYENYRMKIPSVLHSLKQIQDFDPDKIIISTPGPIGLLALLVAKIMNVECVGIYHTDFIAEAEHIIQDDSARNLMLGMERWFYNQMNEIRVPTKEYKQILNQREITADRVKILKRGIETDIFYPYDIRKLFLPQPIKDEDGITLLYAGRISKDKSLELLAHVYLNLAQKHPELKLIIAGNGPFLSELKEILADCPNVVFTGAMPRENLARYYNAADYFIFPSVSDTFGMVILEAQACGLPVIVSNHGGPKEIIIPSETGFIVPDQNKSAWISTIEHCIDIYKNHKSLYEIMRRTCHEHIYQKNNWKDVMNDLLGDIMV